MKTTFYLGQTIAEAQMLAAMKQFDAEERASFPESRWRKFAVEHLGRRYPPKQLMRLIVTDREIGTGGYQLNSRYGELGFTVVNLTDPHKPLPSGVAEQDEEYTPPTGDRRQWVERAIKLRRGQQKFRNGLRKRYGDACMATGCAILSILEAAHISPHQAEDDHHETNGLLLRSDVHTLFDLDLLGIEPDELHIELHPDVEDEYADVVCDRLICPNHLRPSSVALRQRYERFKERCELPL